LSLKNWISIIILTFLLFSCGKSKVPKYTLELPKEKLIAIMIDLHVAEIAIQEFPPEQQDSMKMIYVTQIFTIHKTDKSKFESSYNELLKNPVLNSHIQTAVLDTIKVLQEKIRE
jgi:hypothetical protein